MYNTSYSNERQTMFVENQRLSELSAQVEAGQLADQADAARARQIARLVARIAARTLGRLHRPQMTSNAALTAEAR